MTSPHHAAGLSGEFTFLVQATRWPHDEAAIRQMNDAAREVSDMALLAALSRQHHVCGLVARALAHCPPFAGIAMRHELRREAFCLAEEQFRQLVQTHAATKALKQAGIPVVVLKGTPAALEVYGQAGLRRSVDIDLLVSRRDIAAAARVLQALDYRRSEPPFDASPRMLRAHDRFGKDWGFDHYHSDTGVELHWRLFQNPYLLPGIGIADAIEREVVPGIVLPVLPPRLARLYMVAHGAEHGWARLKWLADLAATLRREPVAADLLLADAREHGTLHLTMASLLLVHDIYGIAPSSQRPTATAWRTRKLQAIARTSLLGRQDGTEPEACPAAITRKNLSHYLFRADPRYWWREFAYDMWHDAGRKPFGRIVRRVLNVLRVFNAGRQRIPRSSLQHPVS